MHQKLKLTVFTTALILSSTCFADDDMVSPASNLSIGLQAGLANMDYQLTDGVKMASRATGASTVSKKIASRIYADYALLERLSVELGYTYYGNLEFRDNLTGVKEDFPQYGIDLVSVASLPFDYGFSGYLKAGATVVHRGAMIDNQYFIGRHDNNKCALIIGLGAAYAFTNNWSGDLGYTRIGSNGDLPKTDFYTIGLNYKFQ